MVEKPTTGDEQQRREQTRAAREQSGLAPEETTESATHGREPDPADGDGEQQNAREERGP